MGVGSRCDSIEFAREVLYGRPVSFAGFTEADFDAYLPARGSSNAYNRPRLEVKQKLVSLARGLQQAAARAGIVLEARASEEAPSFFNKHMVTEQWLFLWRDAEARRHLETVLDHKRTLAATLADPTPYFRHAFLSVYLDASRIEVAFKVHGDAWVDVRNLRARCTDPRRRDELLTALHALPQGYEVGVTGGAILAAHDIDGPSLTATFEALTEASQWWFVGRTLHRAEAIALGPSIAPWIAEGFEALLPVYKIAAWAHDNDLVSIEHEIEAARAERQQHLDAEAAREAAWRAQHEADIARRREAAAAETRERLAALAPARAAVVHAFAAHRDAPPSDGHASPHVATGKAREAPAPRTAHPTSQPAPRDAHPAPGRTDSKPLKPSVEGERPVTVGAKVKVRSGPFAERVGTVAEIDTRGHARVMFGLIAARLETSELVPIS